MMKSIKENFWFFVPAIIIIPVIITTIIIHEKAENEIIAMTIDYMIIENERNVKEIASNIESIYEIIDSKLDFISATANIDGVVSQEEHQRLEVFFEEINQVVPIGITITNEDFEVFYSKGDSAFLIGSSIDNFQHIIDSSKSMKTTIGHVIEDGKAQVLLSRPYGDDNGFRGIALITFALDDIVSKHGNIETEDEEFLFVIDKNYDIIVDPVLVGENLFGESVVGYIGLEGKEAEHYEHVLGEEKFYTSVYTNNLGERVDTGIPIRFNGEVEYFLFIIAPTASTYEFIGDITALDQIQTVALMIIIGVFVIGFSLKQRRKIKSDKLAIIGQLSSNIAHDIRNPLGAIRSASIIIEKENKNENKIISRELDRLKISTKRISHQVEEVLNYVRITPLQLKQNSILKTINESINSIDVPENISISLPQKDIQFVFDKEKILIVFINIVLNAIQSIGETKGYIKIDLEEYESEIIVHLENSGPSIPENDLHKLFEPLFTTRLKGTGLGLSSCKNIISQHRGAISVTQEPVRFSIRLPKNLE